MHTNICRVSSLCLCSQKHFSLSLSFAFSPGDSFDGFAFSGTECEEVKRQPTNTILKNTPFLLHFLTMSGENLSRITGSLVY